VWLPFPHRAGELAVNAIRPAGEIVRELASRAAAILER
jgi:hypothetical protein